ncbi:MAG: Signal recognition particle [Marteilia pararefringens]
MVLAELGSKLTEALANFKKSITVDQNVLDSLLKEVSTALLKSDVNFKLVAKMRDNIKSSIDFNNIAPGQNKKRLIESSICNELINLLNPGVKPYMPKKNQANVVMFVGLQGAGKTTSCAKYAYYYQKRGWKTCMICADTFRAGAFDQLKQNCAKANIPYYGNYDEIDPAVIASKGVEKFREAKFELIIIDTSGRHKQEAALFEEMQAVNDAVNPDNVVFVMDASIGQACEAQANAFKAAVDVGSVIVTKLDGHAKGGGSLSAISATNSPIIFIGTGEKMTDFEAFRTESFVSKLLGRGDLQGLVEVMELFNKKIDMATLEKNLKQGKFTLKDLQDQFSALLSMGPIDQILSTMPGLKPELFGLSNKNQQQSSGAGEDGQQDISNSFTLAIKQWMTLMDSMSQSELEHPDPINLFKKQSSRVARCAHGCGLPVSSVEEKIKRMGMMLSTFKRIGPMISQLKGGAGGGTNNQLDPMQLNKMSSEMMRHMNPAIIKQMGGQGALGEMMKNLAKIDKRALKGGNMML